MPVLHAYPVFSLLRANKICISAPYQDGRSFIFISATIEQFKQRFEWDYNERIKVRDIDKTKNGFKTKPLSGIHIQGETHYKDYFDLKIFDGIDDIPKLVLTGKETEKWLIFLNHISKGKEIVKKLRNENVDAVFVDSRFSDEDALEEVNTISMKKKFNCRVMVSTSVLDNGVSLSDKELVNLVIIADSREEFIQMLGRKRFLPNAPGKISLYICRRNEDEFNRRLLYRKIKDVKEKCDTILSSNPYNIIVAQHELTFGNKIITQQTDSVIYINNQVVIKLGN